MTCKNRSEAIWYLKCVYDRYSESFFCLIILKIFFSGKIRCKALKKAYVNTLLTGTNQPVITELQVRQQHRHTLSVSCSAALYVSAFCPFYSADIKNHLPLQTVLFRYRNRQFRMCQIHSQ